MKKVEPQLKGQTNMDEAEIFEEDNGNDSMKENNLIVNSTN